ncbi:MAG: hypothetical protein JNM29_00875 [Candidatus Odyssella sp.]|nr:hypothetical protein [Candidatus Odyssella sp.]
MSSQYRPKPPGDPLVRSRMESLSAPHGSLSAKIRALHAAGYSRSLIAGFLGKGYQQVRNVLVAAPAAPRTGVAESAPPEAYGESAHGPPSSGVFDVDAAGRITLSPHLLAAVDALPSRRIPWRMEKGEIVLMSNDAAWRQIDRLTGELKRRPGSVVDKLVAERRAEFDREERRFSGRAHKHE